MSRPDSLDTHGVDPMPVWSERLVYRAGWWWGFASGAIVGCCSGGLLVFLVMAIARAWTCPQC